MQHGHLEARDTCPFGRSAWDCSISNVAKDGGSTRCVDCNMSHVAKDGGQREARDTCVGVQLGIATWATWPMLQRAGAALGQNIDHVAMERFFP